MIEQERALRLVYETIDQVNQLLPAARRLSKSPDTVIVGPNGSLDSLGVVSFVVSLEERLADELSLSVQLLDETALSNPDGPFRTAGGLAEHIVTLAGP